MFIFFVALLRRAWFAIVTLACPCLKSSGTI
jgi:hypothetical protein